MRREALCAAAIILAMGQADAAPVVINFDGFGDGTILAVGSFDGLGVRFDQTLQVDDGDQGGLALSTPNYVFNQDNFAQDITGFFLGPVTSVDFISVFAGDQGTDTDTVTLNGYNALNILVATASFTGAAAQTLSISAAGITRFEIIETGLIGIDDFTFNPEGAATAVPEPTSLVLMGLGGVGLFGGLRRRRRQTAA